MQYLSQSLAKAQLQPGAIPSICLKAVKEKLNWQVLYSGDEAAYFHAMAPAGDGGLIRARITPVENGRMLYVQRLCPTSPDYSAWGYLNEYNVVVLAMCSYGSTVSLFIIKSNRRIERLTSVDGGLNWGTPVLIDYSPTTAINGISAAAKPNGDASLFFADHDTLYVKLCVSGVWQTRTAWSLSTGSLSGVSAIWNGDWLLVVTGKDSSGNYRLWRTAFGDGVALPAVEWAPLYELAGAPAGEDYTFAHAYLSNAGGIYRVFYVEQFSGNESYHRNFCLETCGDDFLYGYFREVEPFGAHAEYGLAMAATEDYLWAGSSSSVFKAALLAPEVNIEDDVVSLSVKTGQSGGGLTVELCNANGCYTPIPAEIEPGSRLEFNPGYITDAGSEVVNGPTFIVTGFSYIRNDGQKLLHLEAVDGWQKLADWTARYQYRWNDGVDEASIAQILAFLLGRVGVLVDISGCSTLANTTYPDFIINPGGNGLTAVKRLLSLLPDILCVEGMSAKLIDSGLVQAPDYCYYTAKNAVTGHIIWSSSFSYEAYTANHVQVEGENAITGEPVIASAFDWENINLTGERLEVITDSRIGTLLEAQARADAILARLKSRRLTGIINTRVNVGQKPGDVIGIIAPGAGLHEAVFRVSSLKTIFEPLKGRFEQVMGLEGG